MSLVLSFRSYLIFVYVHLWFTEYFLFTDIFVLQYQDDKTRIKEVVKSGKVLLFVYNHESTFCILEQIVRIDLPCSMCTA